MLVAIILLMSVQQVRLSDEQKKLLRQYIKYFETYSKSEEYLNDINERREREKLFAELLDRRKLESMTEYEFGELISMLWAAGIWSNKEYFVQRLLAENGIDNIRKELVQLLYGDSPFEERFNAFMRRIKGLGPASVTEILCFFDPMEYGIWNSKARKALGTLGFGDILPLRKYQISGREYARFNDVAKWIAGELRKHGFRDADLLTVDYFLYTIWRVENSAKFRVVSGPTDQYDFDHNEIRDFIRDIGLWLGFEAETEKQIGPGARVDVIWRAKIANLGVVTYVFEVHRNGSIDSLILNLQKAIRNPTVQKVIAVSDVGNLEKIQREVSGLSEDFVKSLAFWEVSDVERTHDLLSEAIKSIEKLELVKSEFGD